MEHKGELFATKIWNYTCYLFLHFTHGNMHNNCNLQDA
jgi:hypothetical protein